MRFWSVAEKKRVKIFKTVSRDEGLSAPEKGYLCGTYKK